MLVIKSRAGVPIEINPIQLGFDAGISARIPDIGWTTFFAKEVAGEIHAEGNPLPTKGFLPVRLVVEKGEWEKAEKFAKEEREKAIKEAEEAEEESYQRALGECPEGHTPCRNYGYDFPKFRTRDGFEFPGWVAELNEDRWAFVPTEVIAEARENNKIREEKKRAREEAAKKQGVTLATERQKNVIRRASADWFDIFDGASGYNMSGPTEAELEMMSRREASRLIGIILDGGV